MGIGNRPNLKGGVPVTDSGALGWRYSWAPCWYRSPVAGAPTQLLSL